MMKITVLGAAVLGATIVGAIAISTWFFYHNVVRKAKIKAIEEASDQIETHEKIYHDE